MSARIHVLHENPAWLPPLAEAFDRGRLPWTEWFLHEATFDLAAPPPEGVFYNRMSASSHTRDHRFSAELTAAVLAWLTRWGRAVINGPRALDLEISKVRQYAALERHGIADPHTVLTAGRDQIMPAARRHFAAEPIILKPNRGGKGLGVQLFASVDALAAYVDSPAYEPPVDGLQLAAGIRPLPTAGDHPRRVRRRPLPLCCRGGYHPRLRTLPGRRLRCRRRSLPCWRSPLRASASFRASNRRCAIRSSVSSLPPALTSQVWSSSKRRAGRRLVYDVNTNTNYNPEAEAEAGIAGTSRSGPGAIAAFLGAQLADLRKAA